MTSSAPYVQDTEGTGRSRATQGEWECRWARIFGETLASWSGFYGSVAAVAATLIGPLFVALALNPKIMNTRSRSGIIALAGQTFHSFLVVMVLALIAQIPDDSRRTLVIALVFVGV